TADADYQLTPLSAADPDGWVDCYGARRDATDSLSAAVGDTVDPLDPENGAAFVSLVEMNSSLAVVSADFGLSVAQSWGDAPAPYATANADGGPYASPRRGAVNYLYLGDSAGVDSDGVPDAEADAHAGDDGLSVAPVVNGQVGDFTPAQSYIMAAGQRYRFRLKVSGETEAVQASTARAWITGVAGGAVAGTFDTALLGSGVGGCLAQPDAAGQVSCDYTAPTLPGQGFVPVYLRARVSSDPDVTATSRPAAGSPVQQYGEVEDYQLGVASSLVQLQARTLGEVPANVGLSLTNVSATAPSRTTASVLTDSAEGFVAALAAHAVVDRAQPVVITTYRLGAVDAINLGGWRLSDRASTGTYCWDADDAETRLPTTVDAQGRTLSVNPPAGGLPRELTCRLTYVPRGDADTAWVAATPSDNESTPLRAREDTARVRLNVTGTVRNADGAEVVLAAEGEKVVLELEPRAGAAADGARLEFSPDGGTTWTPAGQSFECYIDAAAGCETPLRVWGQAAGGYNLKARIDDTFISKQGGGVSADDPVRLWFTDEPVDGKSYLAITADADQRADYLAPGVPMGMWGQQTITVTLRNSVDRAYTDGAARLVAVSPLDGGDGLYYAAANADRQGVFSCKDALDLNGQCANGVYTLTVYAKTAGAKQVKVAYNAADQADAFAVKTLPLVPASARLDYVVANFTVPPPSAANSEFFLNGVGQTNPEFDPNGTPVDHSVGFAYSPAVRVWDAGRNNLVPDADVRFTLSDPVGQTCPVTFPGGSKTVTVQSGADPAQAGFGIAGTSVASNALGSCVVTAEAQEAGVWKPVTGSPKTLTWVEDVPIDPTLSWFAVSADDVVANGVATGTVKVRLVDENGYLVTGKAGSLLGRGPQGAAVAVGPFSYDPGEGAYLAAFRGTQAGNHLIAVTFSATATISKQSGGNDTAHLVPGPADPQKTVESLVVGGTRQANGVAAV
ncbi:MAG: hypothetical protein LBI84_10190, partial [Propionibacteriaceae bacterium]|nr:hypothetical protein [Propionibacteriaceae bacterium]